MLTTVLAFQLLFSGGPAVMGSMESATLVGEGLADALRLSTVLDLPGQRLSASGDAVVQDTDRTTMTAYTNDAWATMQRLCVDAAT